MNSVITTLKETRMAVTPMLRKYDISPLSATIFATMFAANIANAEKSPLNDEATPTAQKIVSLGAIITVKSFVYASFGSLSVAFIVLSALNQTKTKFSSHFIPASVYFSKKQFQ